jgi:hypothetical protein
VNRLSCLSTNPNFFPFSSEKGEKTSITTLKLSFFDFRVFKTRLLKCCLIEREGKLGVKSLSFFLAKSILKPLVAMDDLARSTMKNAAKCDTQCELQDLVNHQIFERTLRFLSVADSYKKSYALLTLTESSFGLTVASVIRRLSVSGWAFFFPFGGDWVCLVTLNTFFRIIPVLFVAFWTLGPFFQLSPKKLSLSRKSRAMRGKCSAC